MRRGFVLGLALSAMGAAPPESGRADAPAPAPQVYAVEIKKPEPGQHGRFDSQEGVTVKVFVPQPRHIIIGVDEQASKLTSFEDDLKTDLSAARSPNAAGHRFLSPFSQVTQDGHAIKLDLRAPQPPAPGARSIQIRASVALRVGSEEKQELVNDVSLADSRITLAGMNVSVKKAKDPRWGDYHMSVTLTANRPQDFIRRLAFIGADGQEIKSGVISRSSFSFGGGGNWDVTYGLEQVVEKASIRVEYFDKVEVVSVPLDMDLGVGF